MNFPIQNSSIEQELETLHIPNLGTASIRELVALVNKLEEVTQSRFVRMEMGVPGLPSPQVAIEAERKALENGVTAVYPNLDGIPELKTEIARFVKLFMNIEVQPKSCMPTVGSMQGAFASMLVTNRCHEERTQGTIFIDPGFNLHKVQCEILNLKYVSFDVYNHRGEKLKTKLEEYLSTGGYNSIVYSNPNNPTWQCFTVEELQIIGELATKYNVIVIEDLAYFGMDFRKDYSKPGEAPFQPTVAHYTENYILTISSSKAFSYAGQRIGMLVIGDDLYNRKFSYLKKTLGKERLGEAMTGTVLYAISAGVTHTAQWGLTALLKATNNGEYNFRNEIKIYQEKAILAKKLFLDNGFHIVYDKDGNEDIADGFYFTVGYKELDSGTLLKKMLQCGLCALTLQATGSEQAGAMRICISQIPDAQFPILEKRLKLLNNL